MGTDRKTTRKRWYIVLGIAGALAIGGGVWALVAGLSSSGNREGASCTGTCGRRSTATYGSTIEVYNNGPYALRVTDVQNGVPAQIIPSCTTDTYWPYNPAAWWTSGAKGLFPPTWSQELTDKFRIYPKADITKCYIGFTGKVKSRTTDVDLLIETCVPNWQSSLSAGEISRKRDWACLTADYYGLGLVSDRVKARSSALGVHAIWSDTQTITDNYGGKTETWQLVPDGKLTVDVVASPHARLDPDNPYVYTLQNFQWSRYD